MIDQIKCWFQGHYPETPEPLHRYLIGENDGLSKHGLIGNVYREVRVCRNCGNLYTQKSYNLEKKEIE